MAQNMCYPRLTRNTKNSNLGAITIQGKLNLVTLWKKSIKSQDQLFVSLKKVRHSSNYSRGIDLLSLECFHYIQEFIVNVWTVTKLHLDLIQIEKRILYSKFSHLMKGNHVDMSGKLFRRDKLSTNDFWRTGHLKVELQPFRSKETRRQDGGMRTLKRLLNDDILRKQEYHEPLTHERFV